MYYPDLFPVDGEIADKIRLRSWEDYDRITPALRVGWLDAKYPYRKGRVPAGFVEALRETCRKPIARYKGSHTCEFCGHNPRIEVEGQLMLLGSADIEVKGEEGVYRAPALMLHYVTDHEYLPPDEFVDAVMMGKTPDIEPYKPVNMGRIRVVKDDHRQNWWRWPVDEKPDEEGRSEYVFLYRNELDALSSCKKYRKRGHLSRYGKIALWRWLDGDVDPHIGKLGETTPQDAFPRLMSAFYVQTFMTKEERQKEIDGALACLASEIEWDELDDYTMEEDLEARLTALRKEVEELA